jgi:hypothetical protein
MEIVSPIGRVREIATTSSHLGSLEGSTVGFLTNGWRSWERLIDRMQVRLIADFGVASVERWDIPVSLPAPDPLVKRSARICDLCVVGLGN